MAVFTASHICHRGSMVLLFFVASVSLSVASGGPAKPQVDLVDLSLEELMDVEVTSASRKPQRTGDVASAVFVISQDDIRRSGATTVPEVLRMAPGIHVARIDANKWAVTARGFNGRFANKLLVLIDGRTVYTPLFSGVFWDVEDLMLEDVEQIEVIRGPGASVWGSNAVNGVINIITKASSDSQGLLASVGVGSEDHGLGAVRFGGELGGEKGHYRVYGKYFDRDSSVSPSMGIQPNDGWSATRAGARFDLAPSTRDSVDLHASVYSGRSGETVIATSPLTPFPMMRDGDQDLAGVSVLGRWERQLSESSTMLLQGSYSRTTRDSTLFSETRSLTEVDFRHRVALGSRHEFAWGVGYQQGLDDVGPSHNIILDPSQGDHGIASTFLQDEVAVLSDRLYLTLGTKIEHYSQNSKVEVQPTARLLWKVSADHSLWAAASRAVRTPSRFEESGRIRGLGGLLAGNLAESAPPSIFGLPVEIQLWGGEGFAPEALVAYELGYRAQALEQLSIDTAVYYNDYSDHRFLAPGPLLCAPQGTPASPSCLATAQRVILPWVTVNGHETQTYGFETFADWRPAGWFRLQPTYTFFGRPMSDRPDRALVELSEGQSPTHQWSLRQSVDIGTRVQVDASARYVDSLPFLAIESYTAIDARVAWRLSSDLELALVGRNLFDSSHPEFVSEIGDIPLIETQRSVYVSIIWGR